MAILREFCPPSRKIPIARALLHWKFLIFAALLSAGLPGAPATFAQFQQPLVFSSGGAVAVRNDQTGALTAVSGLPFAAVQSQFTLDVQGRFLFSLGTSSIHMFQITNATTGAYQEVPHSPFASPNTNQPTFIAVEPTGNFIAVVNRAGQKPGDGSVETFQISPAASGGPALIPVPGSATELDSTPIGVAQPPDNKEFLVFLGPNPQSSNPTLQNGSEFQTLAIDPQAGLITGLISGNASSERGDSFAMDPQGRYYALGTQDKLLEVGNLQITGIGGQVPSTTLQLPQFHFPVGLWIDSTGSFLYVATSDLGNPIVVNIYSVNLQTGKLAETASSPLPGATAVPPYSPDPTGSFNYGLGADANTAIAYTVDPLTGYFIETSNSPFTIPQIAGSLTFSIPPGGQGISGPSASLSSAALSFGTIQTGSASQPQSFTLTSNGGQALSVNSIALSGANPSQFQESDTCQVPSVLQPTKFCAINITFAPTATGPQQATVVITDNAPDSPQSVQLSGTGSAPPPPAPQVTVNPSPVTFPTTTQGTTSAPITATVTNTGNATLHISSVNLGGNNSADFSMMNTCNGAYAPNANCSITLTFTPLAAGERSATITIMDDAQNSPQIVQVSGTATPAPITTPLVSLSATTLGFGAVTQGTVSAAQMITVTNSGGAPLHISSVVLGGANAVDFAMSNGCTAASYAVNSGCTLIVNFAPLSTGSRSATITLTDDAPNSPQALSLSGTANAAVTAGPVPGGSTTAAVKAGQTAQYNLQLTAGPGFTGTVSLTCSGAPLAATCSVPGSVQVSGGSATPFTVTVATTGSGLLLMELRPEPMPPAAWRLILIALAAALWVFALLFAVRAARYELPRPARCKLVGAVGCAASLLIFCVSGCGGGGSTAGQVVQPPPPVVTPSGTSTITVTPSATSSSGNALQLQAIQLTLTVN